MVVFARGSGQNDPDIFKVDASEAAEIGTIYRQAGVNSSEKQTAAFFKEFHKRVPTNVKYVSLHNETSSTGQKYNQYGYVAASAFDAIATPNNNYLRPPLHRKDVANRYYESVKDGAEELAWYLEDQMTSCPSQQVVLGGYSQGAEVITDGINILQPDFRSRIAFTALYGDPKYNSVASYIPYKIGNWVRGNTVNSITHGVLDARVPYVPDQLINMASWCAAGDVICDAGVMNTNDIYRIIHKNIKFNNETHSNVYQGDNQNPGWIAKSMGEIVKAVKDKVPNVDTATSVYVNKGDKLWNLDLAIVIDDSSSMADAIKTIKGSSTSLATSLLDSYWNSRVGIVTYGGLPAGRDDPTYEYSHIVTSFTNDGEAVRSGIQSVTTEPTFYNLLPDGTPYQVSIQSAQYAGIMTAIQGLQWEHGAQKKIIVITNNKATAPDPSPSHWTADQVRKAAFDLDPAGLNLANVSCGQIGANSWGCDDSVTQDFQQLADKSGGQANVVDLSYGSIDDLQNLLGKIQTQPVASITGDQTGYVGEPVYLNGDESYDPDSAITFYYWDCDSDGRNDGVASWPTTTCTYSQPGDYLVTLTASSEDGQSTLATMPVHIAAGSAPAKPAAPGKPDPKLTYGANDIRLSWNNTYDDSVYIKVSDDQDNSVGYVPANAASVTLSGIGSEVPELHISACTDAGGCSEPAVIALEHDTLDRMTAPENAETFVIQEAAETSNTSSPTQTSGAEQKESAVADQANPNIQPAKTFTVKTVSGVVASDIITPMTSSVLGDTTIPQSVAQQLHKQGIAATSTTHEQDKAIPLRWRLIIGVPAIVLGIVVLARYFWLRKKNH